MSSRLNRSGTVESATLAESITLIRVEFGHQVGLIPGAYRLSVPRGIVAGAQLKMSLRSNRDPTLIAAGVGVQPSVFQAVHQAGRGRTALRALPTDSRNGSRLLTHRPECFQHVGGASGQCLRRNGESFDARPDRPRCFARPPSRSHPARSRHTTEQSSPSDPHGHTIASTPLREDSKILAKGRFNRRHLSADNREQFAFGCPSGANSRDFLKFRRINARARPSICVMGRRLSPGRSIWSLPCDTMSYSRMGRLHPPRSVGRE